mmetsp:Transcript_65840/g.77364  ORF Transcript_65840/g.77364 Transcript_65840/m.77364 type:complete len:242 (-) Transcript_65840:2012-2737(-)
MHSQLQWQYPPRQYILQLLHRHHFQHIHILPHFHHSKQFVRFQSVSVVRNAVCDHPDQVFPLPVRVLSVQVLQVQALPVQVLPDASVDLLEQLVAWIDVLPLLEEYFLPLDDFHLVCQNVLAQSQDLNCTFCIYYFQHVHLRYKIHRSNHHFLSTSHSNLFYSNRCIHLHQLCWWICSLRNSSSKDRVRYSLHVPIFLQTAASFHGKWRLRNGKFLQPNHADRGMQCSLLQLAPLGHGCLD